LKEEAVALRLKRHSVTWLSFSISRVYHVAKFLYAIAGKIGYVFDF
jgi:hypothetical protein